MRRSSVLLGLLQWDICNKIKQHVWGENKKNHLITWVATYLLPHMPDIGSIHGLWLCWKIQEGFCVCTNLEWNIYIGDSEVPISTFRWYILEIAPANMMFLQTALQFSCRESILWFNLYAHHCSKLSIDETCLLLWISLAVGQKHQHTVHQSHIVVSSSARLNKYN